MHFFMLLFFRYQYSSVFFTGQINFNLALNVCKNGLSCHFPSVNKCLLLMSKGINSGAKGVIRCSVGINKSCAVSLNDAVTVTVGGLNFYDSLCLYTTVYGVGVGARIKR